MQKPLWKPSYDQTTHSEMMRFMHYARDRYTLSLENYADLYEWSIQNPENFWTAIWDFFQVIASERGESVFTNADTMFKTKWFPDAKLNFAENLLAPALKNPEKIALIFHHENGERRTLTYKKLYIAVAKLAAALSQAGVRENDRVAGFMPNMPEAVIAMLATTSLGAVWSSCSPDFGEHGVLDRFDQIQPKILFTTDGYFYQGKYFDSLQKMHTLATKISSIAKILVIPYTQKIPDISIFKNAVLYDDFLKQDADTLQFVQLPFNHPIYILYSSGTTGKPKCIVHGAGGVLLQHLKELVLHTDIRATDTVFYFTTCGWMMWNWQVSVLAIGATIVLYDGAPFYPKKSCLFDLVEQEKVTVFGTSAKFLSFAEKNNLAPLKTHDLHFLRTILSTGSPLPPMHFSYVYNQVKKNVQLSSISGGTDIVSCFALGNPLLPIYSGELQSRGLGMKVEIYNADGQSVKNEKGELVCTAPFPSMPIYFWDDLNAKKYSAAYFEKFPGIWAHGDYAMLTEHAGLIIYGRSDAVLNPGGIRIGTAEIYRQVETFKEIVESLVVEQIWQNDTRVVLFVTLQPNLVLTEALKVRIKKNIRENASPHHVPAKIIQVSDIPKTRNGKIMELAVRAVIHGRPVVNKDALANPDALAYFVDIPELKE